MPYDPKTKQEILGDLVARVVAQSELTDVAEGSTLATLLGAVAEEQEGAEERLKDIRDSFDFEKAVGEDLDERAADFPDANITRVGATAANGAVAVFSRTNTAGTLLVPAGTVVALSADPNVQYRTTQDATFAAGDATVPPTGSSAYVPLLCLTSGTAGNAGPAAIGTVIDGPGDVTGVTNPVAISGGAPRETDEQLRDRLRYYRASLARVQPAALQFYALSYTDSSGQSIRHANVYEDATQPGYSELVVDDGSGLTGLVGPGTTTTGTIPASGGTAVFLSHYSPAVEPITTITNVTTGVTHTYNPSSPQWVSIEERGVVVLLAGQTAFSPGDDWQIAGTDYQVYTGFIRELQQVVEGNPNDPGNTPGLRAAGCRVKVTPPDVQSVDVQVNIVALVGADFDQVRLDAEAEIVAYFQALGPGAPYFESQLLSRLQQIEGVRAASVLKPGGPELFPLTNRKVLRVGALEVI